MSGKQRILNMALDAIGSADDVARTVGKTVKSPKAAATKALDAIADTADDWGWKGGKPNEITGNKFMESWDDIENSAFYDLADELQLPTNELSSFDPYMNGRTTSRMEELMDVPQQELATSVIPQIQKLGETFENQWDVKNAMEQFARLEDVDIPRAWTGKVYKALRLTDRNIPEKKLSSILRSMYIKGDPETTLAHRETFLSLLPEWSGTLDDLAEAARVL